MCVSCYFSYLCVLSCFVGKWLLGVSSPRARSRHYSLRSEHSVSISHEIHRHYGNFCLYLMMKVALHSCERFSCFFHLIRKVTQAFCVIMKTGLYYLAGPIMKVIYLLNMLQVPLDPGPI